VASLEELRSLAPEDVFVRWMAATHLAERLRRATGQAHSVPMRYAVLGVVMEGESAAHAVYRVQGFMHGAHVETLRMTESGWRLSLDGVISRELRTHVRVGPRVVS